MDEKKQIEEMAEVIDRSGMVESNRRSRIIANDLYLEGYRKQRDGEWQIKTEIHRMLDDVDEEIYVECPFCKRTFWVPYEFEDKKIFEYAREHYPYCNCGAKMKGGAE